MIENISEKIVYLRNKANMTQKTLSEKLGVTNRAISNWELQTAAPSIENIFKLAKIFDVPMEYFFDENKEKTVSQNKYHKMESLRELYRVGRGPSSSHTIGPERACKMFKSKNPDADCFKVALYGSLAKTGRGHGTDEVIKKVFMPFECEVEFNVRNEDIIHPNTMDIFAYKNGEIIDKIRMMSVGGGKIVAENEEARSSEGVYELTSFDDIKEYCTRKNIRIWEYVLEQEGEDFAEYVSDIWEVMKRSIQRGLLDEGVLPGGLNVAKKARLLFNQEHIDESAEIRENRIVSSYAFAVGEQNASGETIVTAPTCGAAGVLPAVLYYNQQKKGYTDTQIIRALMTAGIVGNLIKTNASISGAECGCQAEIGSACSMASAALAELYGLNIDKIEYAAEIAMEHHLGLTCDPICGLVQIPCIERNAVAAMQAINAVYLSSFLSSTRKISFDKVIITMKETGHDISNQYKETSEGGLAKIKI